MFLKRYLYLLIFLLSCEGRFSTLSLSGDKHSIRIPLDDDQKRCDSILIDKYNEFKNIKNLKVFDLEIAREIVYEVVSDKEFLQLVGGVDVFCSFLKNLLNTWRSILEREQRYYQKRPRRKRRRQRNMIDFKSFFSENITTLVENFKNRKSIEEFFLSYDGFTSFTLQTINDISEDILVQNRSFVYIPEKLKKRERRKEEKDFISYDVASVLCFGGVAFSLIDHNRKKLGEVCFEIKNFGNDGRRMMVRTFWEDIILDDKAKKECWDMLSCFINNFVFKDDTGLNGGTFENFYFRCNDENFGNDFVGILRRHPSQFFRQTAFKIEWAKNIWEWRLRKKL